MLPVEAETTLLNKSDKAPKDAAVLQLRDNRFHQVLIKLNLDALPGDARIESAELRLHAGWKERTGTAKIELNRMLSEWAPAATWQKPDAAQSREWNGMQKGADYESDPFASWETDDFKTGWITIPGLERQIAAWKSGSEENYGFALQLFGRVTQINVTGSAYVAPRSEVREVKLEPGVPVRLIVQVDPAVIRRLVLDKADIQDAGLLFHKVSREGSLENLRVTLPQIPGAVAARVEDRLSIKGLGSVLKTALETEGRDSSPVRMEMELVATEKLVLSGPNYKEKPKRAGFAVDITKHPSAALFESPVKIRPGVYTTSRNGHLYYGNERLRIWGSLGYGNIERIKNMGFNGWRLWPVLSKSYGDASVTTGEFAPSTKGDGGELDKMDAMFAELKSRDIFVMATQLMGIMPLDLLTKDGSFVSGGADWEEWRKAVRQKGVNWQRCGFVDERLLAARKQHIRNVLTHVNPYTGRRYAEEEGVAIWEIDNEIGFVKRMLDGEYEGWPEYFRNKLQARWNAWLLKRYETPAAIRTAWGTLGEGETDGAILPGPSLRHDKKYPQARGRDFVRFIIELADAHYQELRAFARTHAPAGVGVAVAPFSFDTQYRPSLPWLYSQSRSDVANFGMYFWGLNSALTSPPSAYVMDSSTVEGKPTIIYETNQGRPSPFRAEYPYKLAALASWQDWDAIFFHYWGAWDMNTNEEFLTATMPHVTVDHFWNGVHHHSDPVMTSAMAVAGRMFLSQSIRPAAKPVIYKAGSQAIFSYDFVNGLSMGKDAFAHGARIRFEPAADARLDMENARQEEAPSPTSVKAGDELTWDWQNGRLIIDAPRAKAFVGPVPAQGFAFKDGITLSGLSTPWISFGLAAEGNEDKPLTEAFRSYVSAVFDARNTGYVFDWTVEGGPVDQAKATKNRGTAPALVDKVDFTLSFPHNAAWKFRGYDFALRTIAEQTGLNNVVRVRREAGSAEGAAVNKHQQEVWVGILERKPTADTGATTTTEATAMTPATPVVDPSPGAQQKVSTGGTAESETSDARLAGVWSPLQGVAWGDSYARVHRSIRESGVRSSSISPYLPGSKGEKGILWGESNAILDSAANIEIRFENGVMRKIIATFVQPPDFRQSVAAYEKLFGAPAEKLIAEHQYNQSTVRWLVTGSPAGSLTVQMTDAQGIMKITYELKP